MLLLPLPIMAQKADTSQVFSLEKCLQWVREYHPVMQQANLLDAKADAAVLEARGVLDPKWFGEYEDKSFDQKNYFRVGEAGLKIPVWWGMDVKLGYLWSSGDFLNPENKLPQRGQAIVGVEVPLLRGLTFDQRRAQVRQARLYREVNAAARRKLVNDLLLEAIETYWQWAYQYQAANVFSRSLELAENRFEIVKESFLQGDKPAIDTLESLIQVQNRRLQLNQAQVELQNAALALSNFLWYEDLVPLEVSAQLRPEDLISGWSPASTAASAAFLENLKQTHPDLQTLMVKQQQLEIKERLKREQFKPQLNFNYNFLGNGFDWSAEGSNDSNLSGLFTENYKLGFQFNYPLLLRKERGGLELVKLEQIETQYKLQNKTLQVGNKIQRIFQLLRTAFEQMNTQQTMTSNYQTLLAAENEKFRIGESSIFLLNNREQKLIESQLKLNKLRADVQKLRWKLEWAKGELR